MSRLVIGLIWLLHWLPLALLARVGSGFGRLLYWVVVPRRKVALTNLRLCFPELSEPNGALARRNFALIGRSMLERGLAWWASPERLRATVRIEGLAHLRSACAPRAAWCCCWRRTSSASTWRAPGSRSRATSSACIRRRRTRSSTTGCTPWPQPLQRPAAAVAPRRRRATVKAMKSGRPFYYPPDLDYGRKESIFVPFFGVQAATITGLPRLGAWRVRRWCPITRILPGGQGYVELGAPWADHPSDDVEADTLRMNAWLEGVVRTMPEQYYWLTAAVSRRGPRASRGSTETLEQQDETALHQDARPGQRLRRHRRTRAPVDLTPARVIGDRRPPFRRRLRSAAGGRTAARPDVDFRYRIFNADGGEVEQCGNGALLRALRARQAAHRQGRDPRRDPIRASSSPRLRADGLVTGYGRARAGAGEGALRVRLGRGGAAAAGGRRHGGDHRGVDGQPARGAGGGRRRCRAGGVEQGARIERHERFPARVNAGFLQVVDAHEVRLRVFERGAGETLACGTGACAAVVAASCAACWRRRCG